MCLAKFIENQTTLSIVAPKFLELIFQSWSHSLKRYIWGNFRSNQWHDDKCLTTGFPGKKKILICSIFQLPWCKYSHCDILEGRVGRRCSHSPHPQTAPELPSNLPGSLCSRLVARITKGMQMRTVLNSPRPSRYSSSYTLCHLGSDT